MVHPAKKQATGIARPADLKLARRAVRQGPQAARLAVFGMVIHTISVVPQSTTTSPSRSAPATSCSHSASTEPAASTASASRSWPDRGARPLDPRHAVGRRAALRATVLAPAGAVEQRIRRTRAGIVEDRLARQRVVGHCRRGPVPLGVGRLSRRPAQEFDSLAGEELVVGAPGPLPRLSPYSRPGVSGLPTSSTAVSDGTIAVTATAVASGLPVRPAPPTVPAATPRRRRARGGRGRHPELVRNSCPGHYLAVLVGGHCLDGGRADVDADCDVFG